jgi:hypothetical protein
MQKETAQRFARDIVNLAPEDFHGTVAIPIETTTTRKADWSVVVMLDGEVDDVLLLAVYAVEFLEDWRTTMSDDDEAAEVTR